MPYSPIYSKADVQQRLVIGETREDHWLDFKSELGGDYRKIARNVAQFANASGGTLVIGAQESNQIFSGFNGVPDPPNVITRIDDIVKAYLTPVPIIEPHALEVPPGINLVIVNVPPSLGIVALHEKHERFEFPIRSHESKRYMNLMEVEARMQNKERAMKLRIEKIPNNDNIRLDAYVHGTEPRAWTVKRVDDDTVTLRKGSLDVPIPLIYVEAVYPTKEDGASWVIGLSCALHGVPPGTPRYIYVVKHTDEKLR